MKNGWKSLRPMQSVAKDVGRSSRVDITTRSLAGSGTRIAFDVTSVVSRWVLIERRLARKGQEG